MLLLAAIPLISGFSDAEEDAAEPTESTQAQPTCSDPVFEPLAILTKDTHQRHHYPYFATKIPTIFYARIANISFSDLLDEVTQRIEVFRPTLKVLARTINLRLEAADDRGDTSRNPTTTRVKVVDVYGDTATPTHLTRGSGSDGASNHGAPDNGPLNDGRPQPRKRVRFAPLPECDDPNAQCPPGGNSLTTRFWLLVFYYIQLPFALAWEFVEDVAEVVPWGVVWQWLPVFGWVALVANAGMAMWAYFNGFLPGWETPREIVDLPEGEDEAGVEQPNGLLGEPFLAVSDSEDDED